MFICGHQRRCDCAPSLKRTRPIYLATVCNVSDRAQLSNEWFTAATTALGGLDVLVNNAGISGPTAPVETMDPDAWEAVLRVNLIGTFNVTRLIDSSSQKVRIRRGASSSCRPFGGRFGYPESQPLRRRTKCRSDRLRRKTLSIELRRGTTSASNTIACLEPSRDHRHPDMSFEGRAKADRQVDRRGH